LPARGGHIVDFEIEQEEWVEFKEKCASYSIPAEVLIKQFVKKFNQDEIELTQLLDNKI
jgi:hypothetical protein